MTMTDVDNLEETWEQEEFAPPCEAYGGCAGTAVAVMVFKRKCRCHPGKPRVCEACLRQTLEVIEAIPCSVRVLGCLVCRMPIEYITWYYF